MSVRHPAIDGLARREKHVAEYRRQRDPIAAERLVWQAHTFRHLVHLLPGESIVEIGGGDGRFTTVLVDLTRGRNPLLAVTAAVASLLSMNSATAQILPPAPKAEHVTIIKGPTLELRMTTSRSSNGPPIIRER
jgi:hypothetical protein